MRSRHASLTSRADRVWHRPSCRARNRGRTTVSGILRVLKAGSGAPGHTCFPPLINLAEGREVL